MKDIFGTVVGFIFGVVVLAAFVSFFTKMEFLVSVALVAIVFAVLMFFITRIK